MISVLRLKNFRCFREAEVRLGPLTVVVGPNASGKTALLHAIAGFGLATARDVWRHDKTLEGELIWRGPQGENIGHFRFRATGDSTSTAGTVAHAGQYLHLDPKRMRDTLQVRAERRLSVDGGNLTNVFDNLPRPVQQQLAQDLARLVPVIQDVDRRPSDPGFIRLRFQDRWNSSVWYEPAEVSDGTILALGLLILQYQEDPVTIVAIEEPEHGLHPYLLGDMVEMLRKLTTGEVGKQPLQIVLATQSAELLEFLQPEEVRFLNRRADDGSVEVVESPQDSEGWKEAYKAHQESLGSLWLSGDLGGIPTG